MSALPPLKIMRLLAENVKRISVVEITPDGSVVEIAGKNGHGKTSVLDSILWGLGGERPIQMEPVRAGEERGLIEIDLGDENGKLVLRVERTFRVDEDAKKGWTTELKIQRADGVKGKDPQSLLNALVGGISFDPLEFLRAKPAERLRIMKTMVPDFDFDAMEKRRGELFETRTDVGREAKRLRAVADTIPVQPTTSESPIDVSPLMDRLAAAGQKAKEIEAERLRRDRMLDSAAGDETKAKEHRQTAADLRKRAAELEGQADLLDAEAGKKRAAVAELPALDALPDTGPMRAEIDKANEHNAQVQKNLERRKYEAEAEASEGEYAKLTDAIDGIDDQIAKAIEEADLPVRGMTFDGEDVRLRGVPFLQASDAEQLRASIAIAMSANPKLRVIRIRDGSLLDSDAMEILREAAKGEGYQIWIERVIADSPEAIIMEDGHVKGATTVSVLDQRKKGK